MREAVGAGALLDSRAAEQLSWFEEMRRSALARGQTPFLAQNRRSVPLPQGRGTISWVNATKDHAFIAPDDGGPDLFVHSDDIGNPPRRLSPGSAVDFDVRSSAEGRIVATNVVVRGATAGDHEVGR